MIQFAVCDDEPFMLEEVAGKLSAYMKDRGLACHISRFASSRELLKSKLNFDFLFLDIQMEEIDGLAVARLLRRQGFSGFLIFITVLKEHVFDAFEVEAYDYLVKPLENSRFQNTMDRALGVLKVKSAKTLIIRRRNTCQIIHLDKIIYCEVLGRKIYLHTKDMGIVDYYGRLNDLEQNVDSRFFKCHRSYLVNLDYVTGLCEGTVILPDSKKIPVSRLREQEFTQALLCHMRERRR